MEETSEDTSSSSVRLCHHPNCRKVLVPHDGEPPSKFLRRRHCSSLCSKTNPILHKGQSQRATDNRLKITRVCEVCNGKFARGKGESVPVFRERATCSRRCAADKRKAARVAEIQNQGKKCSVCGGTFHRRMNSETITKFKNRKTCSEECGHRSRNNSWNQKSANGKVRATQVRKLPPATPITSIPEEPKANEVTVWRPATWGGSYTRQVS